MVGTEAAIWHERGLRKKWRLHVFQEITVLLFEPHRTTGISLASEYTCAVALASESSCVGPPVA